MNDKVYATDNRVGMFVRSDTRARLNLLKARIQMTTGQSLSQSEVIAWLLDKYEDESHATERRT